MRTAKKEEMEENRPLAYMDNMERMQLIFSKTYRRGFPYEVAALFQVLPSLLLDLFDIDQALSMLFQTFMKHPEDYPELILFLIFKIFDIARSQKKRSKYNSMGIKYHAKYDRSETN